MSVSRMIRRATLYVTALLLVVGYPLSVMAQAPDATTTDPATTSVEIPPEPEKTYTYNPATGRWDSNVWYYDPATNSYQPVPLPPEPVAPTIVAPLVIDPVAPEPSQGVNSSNENTGTLNSNVTVDITNGLNSDATSGNAAVLKNLIGGNATTGDAATSATIINSVNSAIAAGNNDKVANFTYDVMGDVKGDIMLYPMMLKTMLEAQAEVNDQKTGQTINVAHTTNLTNDLDLSSVSGNATVSANTQAGNATTGSAQSMANVMNILNSMIAANQSFVGTVNIYGSLEGDILVAPDFIPQMIANNKELAVGTISETDIKNQSQDTIINNIALAAQSGSAAVTGNTIGGDATTGSADTNIVIFNLSGHDIVATNSLLVFVNVLGKWVGVILDAPAGTTSAMLGTGVTKNQVAPDLAIDANINNTITNNITMVARSGDALVSHNTNAGNATSGNASAMANVANITNSQIGLGGWFGVLFINVLGDWYGDFGNNTAYGNSPETPTTEAPPAASPQENQVFVFVPRAVNTGAARAAPQATFIDTREVPIDSDDNRAVLAAAASVPKQTTPANDLVSGSFDFRLLIAAGSITVIGLSALGIRRLFKGGAADL